MSAAQRGEVEVGVYDLPKLDHPLEPSVREARLLTDPPWVRSLGRLELSVTTEGWKFPAPPLEYAPAPAKPAPEASADTSHWNIIQPHVVK